MRKRITAGAIGLAIAVAFAGPALAIYVGSITLRNGESFEREFPPIAGMAPSLFHPTLQECRDSQACHVIELTLAHEEAPRTVLSIELDWNDPSGLNDLDLYLWNDAGEEVATSLTVDRPEVTGAADIEPGRYWIGVINWAGTNTGYTLSGSLRRQVIDVYTAPEPAAAVAPPNETGDEVAEPAPQAAAQPEPDAAPAVEPERIATPGSDGPSTEYAVGQLAASQRAEPLGGGPSILTLVLWGLTGAIGAAGVLVVAGRIRREVAPSTGPA